MSIAHRKTIVNLWRELSLLFPSSVMSGPDSKIIIRSLESPILSQITVAHICEGNQHKGRKIKGFKAKEGKSS